MNSMDLSYLEKDETDRISQETKEIIARTVPLNLKPSYLIFMTPCEENSWIKSILPK